MSENQNETEKNISTESEKPKTVSRRRTKAPVVTETPENPIEEVVEIPAEIAFEEIPTSENEIKAESITLTTGELSDLIKKVKSKAKKKAKAKKVKKEKAKKAKLKAKLKEKKAKAKAKKAKSKKKKK